MAKAFEVASDFKDGSFVPHHWVEAWVADGTWVALDPTTGEEGTLGATHVALSEHGDVIRMDVKVETYAPRPPARVAFFNRELAWPVGQERTYSVLHGGKEIGREVARVSGLVRRDDRDAYQMEFSTDVDLEGRKTQAQARLLTTPIVTVAFFAAAMWAARSVRRMPILGSLRSE